MNSLYEFLKSDCIKNPSDLKIYFGRKITGRELLADVDAAAAFLQSKGIKKGDVVVICLPNIPQAAAVLYAVNKVGAIAYVLHPKTGADFLACEVKKTKAKAIFIFDRFANRFKDRKSVVTVVCRASDYLTFPKSLSRVTEPLVLSAYSYKRIIKTDPNNFVAPYIDSEDVAVYLNSGGTTGEPKTVMLSNRAFNELAFNVRTTAKKWYVQEMGMLMALPIFHGFGLGICVHLGLLVGYVVPVLRVNASCILKIMKKVPVNIIVGVPGLLRRMEENRRFKGEFLKNIRLIFVGGDKMSEAVKQEFERKLSENGCDTPIMEGYGLSETASVVTINTQYPHNGSIGQPIEGVKVEIFEGGEPCAEGKVGEIAVNTPSLMSGYLDGEESKYYFKNGDKYLATGDLGYKTGESVYFVGRLKRMIKIGGVNVFPSQIEETAEKFNGVKQACAVRTLWKGKPAVKLLIVTDKKVNDEYKRALGAFLKRSIIKYAEPRIIEKVDKIKTTAIGKADYGYYERCAGSAEKSEK